MRNGRGRARGAAVVIGAVLLASCNPPAQTSVGETPQEGGRRGKRSRVQPTLESPAPTSTPTLDGVEIEVEEGEVVGPVAVTVEQGQTMAFEIKADVEDQVHVHGYEVLVDVGPDQDALFQFEATIPGVFEVELERSGVLLTTLRVEA